MVSGALVKHMAAAAAAVKTVMRLDVASTVEQIKCIVLLQQNVYYIALFALDQTFKLLSWPRNHTVGNSNVISCLNKVNLRPNLSGKIGLFIGRRK